MKRLATILLLAVFSISFTEAGQLLRLPLLFEHYFDHRESNEWSLAEFLHEHYVDSHPDDGDEEEDSRLPFKTINNNTVLLALTPVSAWTSRSPGTYPETRYYVYPNRFLICVMLAGVFHPPRVA